MEIRLCDSIDIYSVLEAIELEARLDDLEAEIQKDLTEQTRIRAQLRQIKLWKYEDTQ